jgi:hypothetical protein
MNINIPHTISRYSYWARGWTNHNRHCVQTGSGAHPVSYPMGIVGLSPGVKRPGREADHSPPSSAEAENACVDASTPPIRLHGLVITYAQGQICFFLYPTFSGISIVIC